MSSLSHSIMVRSSIAALAIGTSSHSAPLVMTKPPGCCDRWRGKPTSSRASARAVRNLPSPGSRPSSRTWPDVDPARRGAPDMAGQRAADVLGEPERLGHLADRAAPAIGDDRRRQPGAVAAVLVVDVLDHLLAPLMLEIDVDVGRLLALGADEALEQQVDAVGIDLGDAEAVADRGVGRRAAALAQDAAAAGEADGVLDGQEIGRVAELADQAELVLERGADLVGDAARIARGRAAPGEALEPRLRGGAVFGGLVGIFVAQLVEAEGAAAGDLDGAGDGLGVIGEQPRHLRRPP